MRKLFQFEEAAEKYFHGDKETLRQALLLGLIRARIELCGDKAPYLWATDGDPEGVDLPHNDESDLAQWRRIGASPLYKLTGWFYLPPDSASKIAAGKQVAHLFVSPDEEEEFFGGIMFYLNRTVSLQELWFEPSKFPERLIQPEDKMLDYMAEGIEQLTDDPSVLARFRVAAGAGTDGISPGEAIDLQSQFDALHTVAVAKAAVQLVREEQRELRAKGGRNRAAKIRPNPEKERVIQYAEKHPKASGAAIKMRLRLKASERSIRKWKSEGSEAS